MSAMLPPEISSILEQMAAKVASKEDCSWINEFVSFEEFESHDVAVCRTHIKDEDMAGLLGRPAGNYSTLQTGLLSNYDVLEDICACLTEELRFYMAPYKGKSLCICGIGNAELPVDCLGPEVVKRIYPKVPMKSDFEKITVFCPGVNGYTNIEASVAVPSITTAVGADCILTVDATHCSDYENLCSSIQLTDAGMRINHTGEWLNQSAIGMPVISIGVPTVIHVDRLAPGVEALGNGLLTVANIQDVIKRAALVIACAILQVAYPELDYQASLMIAEEMLL